MDLCCASCALNLKYRRFEKPAIDRTKSASRDVHSANHTISYSQTKESKPTNRQPPLRPPLCGDSKWRRRGATIRLDYSNEIKAPHSNWIKLKRSRPTASPFALHPLTLLSLSLPLSLCVITIGEIHGFIIICIC